MGEQKGSQRGTGPIESLRDEFREHLHVFYSRLKLAAPYDSVEKALGVLTTTLKALAAGGAPTSACGPDPTMGAFSASLRRIGPELETSRDHRRPGTIQAAALDLPPEFDHLLDLYRTTP